MYSYVVYVQKVHVCIYAGRRDEISDYLLFFVTVHILFLPKRKSERCESISGWRTPIGCLIFIGHFPQKSPIVSGPSAENNLQLQASCGSLPPCTENSNPARNWFQLHRPSTKSTKLLCKVIPAIIIIEQALLGRTPALYDALSTRAGVHHGVKGYVTCKLVSLICWNKMLGCSNGTGGFHENIVTLQYPKFPLLLQATRCPKDACQPANIVDCCYQLAGPPSSEEVGHSPCQSIGFQVIK